MTVVHECNDKCTMTDIYHELKYTVFLFRNWTLIH